MCPGSEPAMKKIAMPLATRMRSTIQAKMSIMSVPLPVQIAERNAVLFFRINHLPPGVIRIKRGHLRGDTRRALAQILLVDVAVIIDDEGRDAGIAVFGRISNKAEPTDHVAVDNVIHGPARGCRALTQQDFVAIAVERFAGARAIAALRCGGDRLTQRARWFIAARRPIESVLLARRADDPLRIDRLPALALVHVGIVLLRVPEREHCLHARELFAADAARQDFLATGGHVENPLAVALHHWDRERPVIRPHYQYRWLAGL